MRINRSMPEDVLIPVLGYPSVSEAVAWLTRFGFTVRWQIEDHRALTRSRTDCGGRHHDRRGTGNV